MTTMRDVARHAGVSVTTVSHVINDTRFVSEEVRQRVLAAMVELGYRPNEVARSLRRKRTGTLGMIVPDSANPFFAEIARSIERVSFTHGYNTILCNSEGDLAKELIYANVLMEKQVDGIIFVAAGLSSEHIQTILRRRMPAVVVDRELPDAEVDAVLSDNLQGGVAAVEHLIRQGHRRIACITGPSDVTPSADRVIGYRRAMTRFDLPLEYDLVQRGDFQFASGAAAMRRFISLPQSPTAVFACNDLMAVGAISAAVELGRRVPDDIAVVGFDDIPLASFTNPPLTSVCQPKEEMGRLAAELLLARIANRDAPPERRVLESRLIVRRSSSRENSHAS